MKLTSNALKRRTLVQGTAALACGGFWVRANAANSGDILIGQSVPLSGPIASTLATVIRGQSLAINDLNARGGLNGRKVRLVALDDAYDPQRTVSNVRRLIDEERVVAIYGLMSTVGILASLPIFEEKKVPLVGVYAGSPVLRGKHHPYFFTTMASYEDEVVQMLRNLKTLLRTQIGLVYQNTSFGQLMLPIVEAKAKEFGATVVVKSPLETNGSDAVAAAQTVAVAQPQAVLYMGFGPGTVPFLKAAKAYVNAPLYCISVANSQQTLAAVGNDARGLAFTQTIPYPWRTVTPLTRDFHRVMASAGLPIDYDHFLGYLNMRILLEGLRRSGANPTSSSLVKALEGMSKIDLGGYVVDYGPTNHHGSRFVEICIVGPGGKYIR